MPRKPAGQRQFKRTALEGKPIPNAPKFTTEQNAIIDAIAQGQNVMMMARAGTAKSTTMEWGLRPLDGKKSILFTTFNAHNVEAFKALAIPGVEASTMHSIGLKILRGALRGQKISSNKDKSLSIFKAVGLTGGRKYNQQQAWALYRMARGGDDLDAFVGLLEEGLFSDDVKRGFDDIESCLDRIEEANFNAYRHHGVVDFVDMLYLPTKLENAPALDYDILAIDEANDISIAGLFLFSDFVDRTRTQVVVAMDPMQGIYQSLGANPNAYEDLITEFNPTIYPLTNCFRCASAIIEKAQEFVPDIQAIKEGGSVEWLDTMPTTFEPDTAVLAAKNATIIPLFIEARLRGVNAVLKGRNIFERTYEQLLAQHTKERERNRSADPSLATLGKTLLKRYSEALLKLPQTVGNEDQRQMIEGQIASTKAIIAFFSTMTELRDFARTLGDEENPDVTFSTIHRAKGDGYDTVILLNFDEIYEQLNDPKTASRQKAILPMVAYVAITRAKQRLVFTNYCLDDSINKK